MKEDLAEYAAALAGGDVDSLTEIVVGKYKKLKAFFKIIRPFNEEIKKMEYDDSVDYDTFAATVHTKKKINMDSREEVISKYLEKGYAISHTSNSTKTRIIITYDESE